MLHIYMKYEAPHSLSTGVNMFLANLSQHKQHDTSWTLLKSGALIMEAGKRITKPLSSKKKWTFHHFSPKIATPKKDKKKAKQLSSRRTCWSLCVCFLMFFCADCSQLEKTRQPRAIPASHGLLKMRKASRPFGLDIENDKVNRPRKPVGRGGWFTRSLRRLEMSMFFFANTQVMPILSLKSLMFFFHLPCFMLSCHFEPTSKATIMGHFFPYNTARCILTLFLPWNICSRLYDGNHITHCFGEFEGHQNQESPRKRCFFSKLFDNSRIGLVSV